MRNADEETEYRGPDIPTPIGEKLQIVHGLTERPERFGDWVEAMAYITDRDGINVDLDVLCTTDNSPHQASFNGDTQHYQCTQDAFIVPFLVDDIEMAEIETESPVSGEVITLTVTESAADVDPSEAVMSFGVAADVEPPPEDVPSPILAYAQICPYGNAFISPAEYEAWESNTAALTMAVSMEDTLELARALGQLGNTSNQ